jgi:hypothetical protein
MRLIRVGRWVLVDKGRGGKGNGWDESWGVIGRGLISHHHTISETVAQHIQCVGLTRELDKEGAGSSGVVYTPAYTLNVVHILVTPLFEGKEVHQQLHHDRP